MKHTNKQQLSVRCIAVFLFFIWLFYVLSHSSAFHITSNTRKRIRPQLKTEYQQGYTEYTGEFSSRQKRINNIEFYVKKNAAIQKADITLLDGHHKVLKETILNNPELRGRKLAWDKGIRIKKGDTYFVQIKLYGKKQIPLKYIQINYDTFLWTEYIAVLFFSVLAIGMLLFDLWRIRKKINRTEYKKISFFTLLKIGMNAYVSFYLMEFIADNHMIHTVTVFYQLHNWILYVLFYVLLLLLFNSSKTAMITGNIIFLIWGMANRYVYLFKGQILQPIDLKSIRTAAHVAREYDYTLTPEMIVTLAATFLLISLWMISIEEKWVLKTNWKKRMSLFTGACAFGGMLWFGIFHTSYIPYLEMSMDMWNSKRVSEQYGTVLAFLGYGYQMRVEKPEGYSSEVVKSLEEKYNAGDAKKTVKPNIIVIMNEAFTDLSYIGDFKTNLPYIENISALKENTIQGHALVSIIGGGTSNSEFEFLTGHTLGFMPGAIPYAQYIQEEHETLASNLKKQGYSTSAIHLMQGNNWRRNEVYPYLGFEDFLSIEDVDSQKEEKVRKYISDKASYKHILRLLDEKEEGKPAFIFDVTGQNHSGYVYQGNDFNNDVKVEGFDSEEVNQYLSLIRKSDEAIGLLIEQLKNYHEPVLVLFYGDHYPRLPEDFYQWLEKDNQENPSERVQKRYSVPFFIWSNYDIEEREDVFTSLNYLGAELLQIAGLEMSPYDIYRLQLSKMIPAINANGYQDKEGVWHTFQEENDYTDLLNEYWIAEYNEMFEEKNKVKSFFQIQN